MNDNLKFTDVQLNNEAHGMAIESAELDYTQDFERGYSKAEIDAKLERRATLRKEVGMNSSKIKQSVRRAKKRSRQRININY